MIPAGFGVRLEEQPHALVVYIHGEIDLSNAVMLQGRLDATVDQGRDVVVDLTGACGLLADRAPDSRDRRSAQDYPDGSFGGRGTHVAGDLRSVGGTGWTRCRPPSILRWMVGTLRDPGGPMRVGPHTGTSISSVRRYLIRRLVDRIAVSREGTDGTFVILTALLATVHS